MNGVSRLILILVDRLVQVRNLATANEQQLVVQAQMFKCSKRCFFNEELRQPLLGQPTFFQLPVEAVL